MASIEFIHAQHESARPRATSAPALWITAASSLCLVTALASPFQTASAAADIPRDPGSSNSSVKIVSTLLANEQNASKHRDHYEYISNERSERTGGHLWTEKVIETDAGKVRRLIAEDGKPLSPQREAQERGRLGVIVADPVAFRKKSQATKDDEAHALQMLSLATRAFLFSDPHEENGFIHIDYRPNPEYQAQNMEERVLHAMSGSLLIDPQMMRLHRIDGRLPEDINIGFGLVTIRAGSNFSTTRAHFDQPDWKTTQVDTAINGRVILFKSIAKNEHAEHSNFVRVSNDLSVAQAVALVEQP
ncbi:MAG: hypothetical protein M3O31_02840 [Acidobacteriota bacterium]|nr:hypothetical protein [Acidobacteriota bacterium]